MNIAEMRTKFPELTFEERASVASITGAEVRVLDVDRKVRTPWLAPGYVNLNAAACAVLRTDRAKLTHRHSIDAEWVIVHSY